MNSKTQQKLRDNRTYQVSTERLIAFGRLSYAERLQWVEQCSQFVRMAQAAKARLVASTSYPAASPVPSA